MPETCIKNVCEEGVVGEGRHLGVAPAGLLRRAEHLLCFALCLADKDCDTHTPLSHFPFGWVYLFSLFPPAEDPL